MKHYLARRENPDFNFIVPEHQQAFEQLVIDLYCESEEGFWGVVPSVEINILDNLPATYMLASLMGEIHNDPSYFYREIESKSLPEFLKYWSVVQFEKYMEREPNILPYCLNNVRIDIKSVLDHHFMLHAFTLGPNPDEPRIHMFFEEEEEVRSLSLGLGTGMQAFSYIPIKPVW